MRALLNAALLALVLMTGLAVQAQEASAPAAPALPAVPAGLKPFAVEFRTGPAWVADKPPPEQPAFREHSANLQRLRKAGLLVLGARIAERGFIVLAAVDEAAARAEIDADPGVRAGSFVYTLSPMAVFYGGSLSTPPRAQ
ncbi:uncharacterized protein YciI [Inhella inkyongensis]|uniref:Uncharacterized protein YciI n=1 Tax=Inhella inkyongensis TaxID=392593 RepID=A0A840S9E4_9BURK|nr:hypothetical protein [Inhella inkyongensis]MBB5205606.1 uncharacterized protein YciI [Inhella inkyongensis]